MHTVNSSLARKRRNRASVALYRKDGRIVMYVRISKKLARELGLRKGSKVLAVLHESKIVGQNDWYVEIREDSNGNLVSESKNSYLIQATAPLGKVCRSTPMHWSLDAEGNVILRPSRSVFRHLAANDNEPKLLPPPLQSLSVDKGFKKRIELLSDASGQSKTAAGDECYTAGFLVDAVRRAMHKEGGKRSFDLDPTTMYADGDYRRLLKNKKATYRWGDTPEQFRHLDCIAKPVPAKVRYTNDRAFGSLARDWRGDYVWLNPPYSSRLWATFLEYANVQVELDNVGIVIALVPGSLLGEHVRHTYAENAHIIELIRQVPFFKREKKERGKMVKNLIEGIPSSRFVVLGKGDKVRRFLEHFLDELYAIEYISDEMRSRYRQFYGVEELWRRAA